MVLGRNLIGPAGHLLPYPAAGFRSLVLEESGRQATQGPLQDPSSEGCLRKQAQFLSEQIPVGGSWCLISRRGIFAQCTHVCTHIHVLTLMHTQAHVHSRAHKYTLMHTHARVCLYVHTHTHVWFLGGVTGSQGEL
jgi:hypothetical protein